MLAFDGGNGRKLCQWWTIMSAFYGVGGGGIRWWWQSLMAFDGTAMDYGKVMVRQRRLAQLEDERAAQGESTQQPAGVIRGREGCATIRRREMMQQPAARRGDDKRTSQQDDETTTGRRIKRRSNTQLAQKEDKRAAQGATSCHQRQRPGLPQIAIHACGTLLNVAWEDALINGQQAHDIGHYIW